MFKFGILLEYSLRHVDVRLAPRPHSSKTPLEQFVFFLSMMDIAFFCTKMLKDIHAHNHHIELSQTQNRESHI